MLKKQFYNIGICLLFFMGSLQLIGFIFGSRKIRGLGMSYCAAPLPTVFSAVNGVEGFDTKHILFFKNTAGQPDSVELGQKAFSTFQASFFLKDAYSIFLAYQHMLKPEQVKHGWHYALCQKNILPVFKLPGTASDLHIKFVRTLYGVKDTIEIIPECNNH